MSKRIVLLQALAATPADLRRLAGNLSPAGSRQASPGSWSPIEVVSHLLDVEARYRARLQRIVTEEQPSVPDILPPEAGYPATGELPQLLEAFATAREETLSFLKGLSAGEWQRRATHPTWGELTLRFFVQHLVEHDTEHLNQLALLKQKTLKET